MTQFVGRSALEARTSGTFNWRVCAGTSAICHATRFCSRERSSTTFALCSQGLLNMNCGKSFGMSDSQLLSRRCLMVSGNESDQEAANSPVASVNGLPLQEPCCNNLGC